MTNNSFNTRCIPLLQAIQSYEHRIEKNLFSINAEGEGFVLVKPFELKSSKTYLDILSSSSKISQVKTLLNFYIESVKISNFLKHNHDNLHEIYDLLGDGITVLIRSQKIIIIDRLNKCVVHGLRKELKQGKQLLENEILANKVLPKQTIPVTFSSLDQQPFFIVQPYSPYSPSSYNQVKSYLLEDVISHLFEFYDYSTIEPVDTDKYITQLLGKIQPSLKANASKINFDKLQSLLGKIYTECSRLAKLCGNTKIFITQTHGDLIPPHIVIPKKQSNPKFLLVDWSECHKYSIFHDLFYLQFQSYNTNFWNKFLSMHLEKYHQYYGKGWGKFCKLFQDRTGIKIDANYANLNFSVCLLQELDHRLNRIHLKYLSFWISQTEKIWNKP